VRTYTLTLTSQQFSVTSSVLDHWLYYDLSLDPISGVNFVYPNSADGSFFSATSGTFVYPFTADGYHFYPAGYGIYNVITYLTAGPLKGPYTFIFDPTGLSYELYGIQKIVYDFGDGQSQIVEYPIGEGYAGVSQPNSPNNVQVSHDYYPLSEGITTYSPSISVVNGNLIQNIFIIDIIIYPGSIYELQNIHLLNNIQASTSALQTINIFEVESPHYITHARVLSAS
jgi:hypothetical protein